MKQEFDDNIIQAVKLAASVVLHDKFLPSFLCYRIGGSALYNVSATEWENTFISAFKNDSFCKFIDEMINAGKEGVKSTEPRANTILDSKPWLVSYSSVRERLLESSNAPHWIALSIVAISRMLGVGATNQYDGFSGLDKFTLDLFDAERSFVLGDGDKFAIKLSRLNADHYNGKLGSAGGKGLSHALVEISGETPDALFFNL